MERKIELAKSWFVLAQISIILAGFLFASGSVAYTNSINTLNLAVDSTEKSFLNTYQIQNNSCLRDLYLNFSSDASEYYGLMTLTNLSLWKICFNLAFILVFVSILLWSYGHYLIKKSKIRNNLND